MKPTQTLLTYLTKQSVDLRQSDGETLATILDAIVYVQNGTPALAVHRPVWVEKDGTHTQLPGYNITHVPTGRKIASTEYQRQAKRLAALLLTLDWTQPMTPERHRELVPPARLLIDGDDLIKFTENDHCCVLDCRNPVLLRYTVHATHQPFLLCEQHWTKLNSATTEKGWTKLLGKMGYSPNETLWWTTWRNIAVTSRRTNTEGQQEQENEMRRKKEKRSQEEEAKALAESKERAKAKREETKRNPLELPEGTVLTETPEGFDWESHPPLLRKWFQIDWQHLVHRAEGHDHEAAKLRDKAEKLKSFGSQKDRAKMTRLTNMRNKMAELRRELESEGIDVASHLNEVSHTTETEGRFAVNV